MHGMLGKRCAYGITFEGMGNSVQLTLNQRVPGSSPGAPTTQSSETKALEPASEKGAFAGHFSRLLLAAFRSSAGGRRPCCSFGASVSGDKNPVPSGKWERSKGYGEKSRCSRSRDLGADDSGAEGEEVFQCLANRLGFLL